MLASLQACSGAPACACARACAHLRIRAVILRSSSHTREHTCKLLRLCEQFIAIMTTVMEMWPNSPDQVVAMLLGARSTVHFG